MPFNSRDLWVVLKAQDLATRALNQFSRSVKGAGTAVKLAELEAAQARARSTISQLEGAKAAKAYELQQIRSNQAANATAISQLTAARAYNNSSIAALKANGATAQQIETQRAANRVLTTQIAERRVANKVLAENATAIRAESLALTQQQAAQRANIQAIQRQKNALIQANKVAREHARNQRILSQNLKTAAQSAYAASFALTAVGAGGLVAVSKLVKASVEYNRQVAYTKTQVTDFKTTLKELSDVGLKVAKKIAVPFDEIQQSLYDIFSSTDANMRQAKNMINQFAKAAVAGQITVDAASRSTMQLMNAFEIPLDKVNRVLDVQFQVVRKGIGTYEQFNNIIGLNAASARRAGQSLETYGAMLVFLTRHGNSASRAVTAAGRALDLVSMPKVTEQFAKLGINVKTASGEFKPLAFIVGELAKKLKNMPQPDRVAALQKLFKGQGLTAQARRFWDIAVQPALAKEFIADVNLMEHSTGALTDAYKEMADTVAAKAQLMKNKWQVLKIQLGNDLIPNVIKFLDVLGKLLDKFDNLSPKTKNMIAQFLLWGSAVLAVIGPLVGVAGIVLSIASALAILGTGLGEVIGLFALIVGAALLVGTALHEAWKKSSGLRILLEELGRVASGLWKSFKTFAGQIKDDFETKLAPAFKKLKQMWENQIVPILEGILRRFGPEIQRAFQEILTDVRKVADWGFKFLKSVIEKDLIPAIQKVIDFYHKHQTEINKFTHYLIIAGKWIAIIAGGAVIGALVVAFFILIRVLSFVLSALVAVANFFLKVGKVIAAIIITTKALTNSFVQFLKDLWHHLTTTTAIFRAFPGKIRSFLSGLPGMLARLASNAMRNLSSKVSSGISSVLTFFRGLPGKIKSAVGSLGGLLLQAGKDLIQGLINGFDQKAKDALSRARNVGAEIARAFASALHLGSPSKLFAYFGRMSILGYALGLKSALPQVKSLMSQAVQGMEIPKILSSSTNSAPVPYTGGGRGGGGVTVNVQTNEIRPEYNAERLGFLLLGRI